VGWKRRDVGLSVDELIDRYQSSETLAVIAATTGLSLTAVYGRLKRAGVRLRPPGPCARELPGVSDADLVARYQAGATSRVIAAETGLSERMVYERLRRAGVEMRQGGVPKGHGRAELPLAEIVDRYHAGESTRTIGRALGVSNWTVRKRLIEAGVAR
jgi:hypothetical protein